MEATFTVEGDPVGKQAPLICRKGGRSWNYTPAKTTQYERLVLQSFKKAYPKWIPLTGAVFMVIGIYCPIPKSLSKKEKLRLSDELIHQTKKPDGDNVEKCIQDALKGYAFLDDGQVSGVVRFKIYSPHPRVEITFSDRSLFKDIVKTMKEMIYYVYTEKA